MRQFYVYIMSNASRTLYTGVTSNLERRVFQHQSKLVPGFTSKYNITRLVYFEVTEDVRAALAREKQIKGWRRARKIALIESVNPGWVDLAAEWYADHTTPQSSRGTSPPRDGPPAQADGFSS